MYTKRINVEKFELDKKLKKLISFIESEQFNELSYANQVHLKNQMWYMTGYSNVLGLRLEEQHLNG